jgi:ADP-ribose pyrophosphatase YjhB (NUDIX family)
VPTDKDAPIFRDTSGRTLRDYPRPSVAVDTALLTVVLDNPLPEQLCVLEVRRAGSHRTGSWALPGTFLHEGERLHDAVHRSLRDKTGLAGACPVQLHVFDDPTRDERGWVLSVAHVDAVPLNTLAGALNRPDVRLMPVLRPGRLPYDHPAIVADAAAHVRARYLQLPDPARLLGDTFTVRDLRVVHDAVAGDPHQKDTFRRAMEPHLDPADAIRSGTVGRPAALFRRSGGRSGCGNGNGRFP